MPELLIVADDLTGAIDTGVKLAKMGVATFVTENIDCRLSDDVRVIVIDTESRHIGAKEAYKRVLDAVLIAKDCGIESFYKKTDSTLRGNIGSELDAIMDATGSKVLAFVPALPGEGRTTSGGIHYVNGIPLSQTPIASDPFNPITDSRIDKIISIQSHKRVEVLGVGEVYKLKNAIKEGGIIVFDAVTQEDMAGIAESLKKNNIHKVTAGCAGLGAFLPEMLDINATNPQNYKQKSGPVLVVIGSLNAASLRQSNSAKDAGMAYITLTPMQKLDSSFVNSKGFFELCKRVTDSISDGKSIIIEAAGSACDVEQADCYAKQHGLDADTARLTVMENIGAIIKCVLDGCIINTLVVFGGDTLFGIMKTMGWDGLYPFYEFATGVAVCRASGYGKDLDIITKAGGFGRDNVLKNIAGLK